MLPLHLAEIRSHAAIGVKVQNATVLVQGKFNTAKELLTVQRRPHEVNGQQKAEPAELWTNLIPTAKRRESLNRLSHKTTTNISLITVHHHVPSYLTPPVKRETCLAFGNCSRIASKSREARAHTRSSVRANAASKVE